MKRYYVTVNGNRYEVEVEEVKGDFQHKSAENAAPFKGQNVKAPEVKEEAPASPAPKAASKASQAEGEKIKCPMPGTIISVNVKEGDTVKEGDLLFVLEAMKMENEIVSPRAGKILSVAVSKGDSVNTDDLLAIME